MKLFGRKILLSQNGDVLGSCSEETNSDSGMDSSCCLEDSKMDEEKTDQEEQLQEQEASELSETNPKDKEQNPEAEEESESDENPKTSSTNENSMSGSHPEPRSEQTETTNGQQKTLKKPEKILPCPRCNSMETKFCYYNNYNVNQPRHFCKSCQRYWTAGGTMRNVPVGAGRRKNKNSASNCRHITISETLYSSRVDCPNGLHGAGIKPNGTVLSFGPDSPLCESMASGLNLADKRAPNGVAHGYYKVDHGGPNSCNKVENKDNSVVDGFKNGPQQPMMQNLNGFPYPVSCIPGLPWTFPVPAICPPGYPMPFYPGPYWNCGVPNAWNVPWIPVPPPSPNQKTMSSNPSPNSPLGKHSRNGELIKPKNSETNTESSIVVPKTLRIDDPEEAAKSPIWETLGIKYDSISREGLFKALQPKGHEKKLPPSASSVLHANPAALSRSICFQEGAKA